MDKLNQPTFLLSTPLEEQVERERQRRARGKFIQAIANLEAIVGVVIKEAGLASHLLYHPNGPDGQPTSEVVDLRISQSEGERARLAHLAWLTSLAAREWKPEDYRPPRTETPPQLFPVEDSTT